MLDWAPVSRSTQGLDDDDRAGTRSSCRGRRPAAVSDRTEADRRPRCATDPRARRRSRPRVRAASSSRRDAGPGLRPRLRRRGAASTSSTRRSTSGSPTGRFADAVRARVRACLGVRHALLVQLRLVGEPARALDALTSPKLGDRRLQPGDEVITVAAGFPTTVNPIIQNGLVPVFVDVELGDLQRRRRRSSRPPSAPRTRAVMIAHTLGNPFDLDAVQRLREGARPLAGRGQLRRARLDLRRAARPAPSATSRTVSFYPAHHITMGEGGAVLTNRPQLKQLVESFRDWGRDCWCEPGKDNTCGKRFGWQLGEPAARLRPQVHLLAHRLQPEAHRHAGGRRRRPAREAARRSSTRGGATSQLLRDGLAPLRGRASSCREATPSARPELVRLPDRRPRGSAVRPRRARRAPRAIAGSRPGCSSAAT